MDIEMNGDRWWGGLETMGKHYVMCLGMFGWPPNMYLNWSLKFEVHLQRVPKTLSDTVFFFFWQCVS